MDFAKGSSIENIFDKLEKILGKKFNKAEEHVLMIYDNLPEKPQSARSMLNVIKEDMQMDCGCCYKLAEPATDILITELTLLQHTINEIKLECDKVGGESAEKIKKLIDHNARIMHVMVTGLKELGMQPDLELYTKTMEMYAATYRIMHNGKPGLFDHIIGMENVISKIVAVRDAKKATENKKEDVK